MSLENMWVINARARFLQTYDDCIWSFKNCKKLYIFINI